MFALFNRKRADEVSFNPTLFRNHRGSVFKSSVNAATSPEDQVALIQETVKRLDEVRHLVDSLPEVPALDRQVLLSQITSTSENLRCLYFLDAIY